MEEKDFQIDESMVKKICGKRNLKPQDVKFINESIESIIKKYGDVYSIERPRRKSNKLGKHRRK